MNVHQVIALVVLPPVIALLVNAIRLQMQLSWLYKFQRELQAQERRSAFEEKMHAIRKRGGGGPWTSSSGC